MGSAFIDKMGELLHINGDLDYVEKAVTKVRGVAIDRFKDILNGFSALKNYLEAMEISEKDRIIFDFGLIMKHQFRYSSGLIFKMIVPVYKVETLKVRTPKSPVAAKSNVLNCNNEIQPFIADNLYNQFHPINNLASKQKSKIGKTLSS